MCFDKIGILIEEGLDVLGVWVVFCFLVKFIEVILGF